MSLNRETNGWWIRIFRIIRIIRNVNIKIAKDGHGIPDQTNCFVLRISDRYKFQFSIIKILTFQINFVNYNRNILSEAIIFHSYSQIY